MIRGLEPNGFGRPSGKTSPLVSALRPRYAGMLSLTVPVNDRFLGTPRFGLSVLENEYTPLVNRINTSTDEGFSKFVYEELMLKASDMTEAKARLGEYLDVFLQDRVEGVHHAQKQETLLSRLAKLMGARGQNNIVMGQINPTLGDLKGNAQKMMRYMDAAERIGADSIVFPEMSLMGYSTKDIITRHPYMVEQNMEWLKALAARSGKTRAVVGFVEPRYEKDGQKVVGRRFYNSAAILGDGKILGVVRKSLLPNYGEFDDWRIFEPSKNTGVILPNPNAKPGEWPFDLEPQTNGESISIHGPKAGIVICEDGWNDEEFHEASYTQLYDRDPVKEVAAQADYLLNVSASPSRSRKEQYKHNMLGYVAKRFERPYVYVNQVGAIDESSYDGASRVYGANGKLVARAKSFREQFMMANPMKGEGKIYALPGGLENALTAPKTFTPIDWDDMGRIYETVVQATRDYFAKNNMKRAVLGLSGGLDSAVSATIVADALGPENVIGVSMPSHISPKDSKSDAKALADKLGVHYYTVPIGKMVDLFAAVLTPLFNLVDNVWSPAMKAPSKEAKLTSAIVQFAKDTWTSAKFAVNTFFSPLGIKPFKSDIYSISGSATYDNIQARSRAMILWALSNQYPSTISIATSDKSEFYMGYATVNGDMSGGWAPIADLTKSQVRTLARWMNENRGIKNAIPTSTIEKPPGADLKIDKKTGKMLTAEADLMQYAFLDEAIWRVENLKQGYNDMLKAEFWYEKNHKPDEHMQVYGKPFDAEQKAQWLKKFYDRQRAAVYKWFIAPPTVLVNGGGSIVKTDYRQPITSGKTDFVGMNQAQIGASLDQARPATHTNSGNPVPV